MDIEEHNRKGKNETICESLMPLLPFYSLSKYINSTDWNPTQILTKNEAELAELAQQMSCIAAEDPLVFLLFIETTF